MNKAGEKKLCSLVLALVVMISAVFIYAQPVMAAEKTVVELYKSEQEETAAATVETGIPFQIQGNGTVSFSLVVDHVSDLTIVVYDKKGNPVSGFTNPYSVATDRFKENEDHKFTYTDSWKLSEGTYTCGLTFSEDTAFTARVYRQLPKATISKKKMEITAGFSQKLTVSGAKVKSWSSKKKSIAAVDKNGKVTGKKSGKTTITATLEDGRKLTCAVTVYKNVYSDTKGTVDMVASNKVVPQPYKAYFDAEGNLKIKMNVLNTTDKNVIALTDLKITVKDENKKTVGICRLDKRTITIQANTARETSFTIPKSQVQRKADLRKVSIYVKGHYQARRVR